jgi:hypothetical protein
MHQGSLSPSAAVIVAARAGRLGNRLFQAAHFMGNALCQGYRLYNPSLAEYAPLFEGSAGDPMCGFPHPWRDMDPELASQCRDVLQRVVQALGILSSSFTIPGIKGIDVRAFDEVDGSDWELGGERFRALLSDERWILPMGWRFTDHKGMIRYRSEITRYFTPIARIRRAAEEVLSRAREHGDIAIGVHVRQDDYRFWKNGAYYFETEEYVRWMNQAAGAFPDKRISFVVCSGVPLDSRLLNGITWTPGPGDPAGDLHALSLCDLIMGPPSTFSGWASYHGEVPLCTMNRAGQVIGQADFRQVF